MKNLATGFLLSSCIVFCILITIKFIDPPKEKELKPYIYTAIVNQEAYYNTENLNDYLWLLEGHQCVVVAKKGIFLKIATEQGYFWIKEKTPNDNQRRH